MSRIFEGKLTPKGIGVALAVGLLGGCSLINPHVTWKHPHDPDERTTVERLYKKKAPIKRTAAATIKDGLDYADRAIVAYKGALGDQSKLTSLTGIALPALSAVALGMAITGVNQDAITGVGLGSATGFVAASWLASRPRKLIYAAGIGAMSCAKEAVIPVYLPADKQRVLNELLIGTVVESRDDKGQLTRNLDTSKTLRAVLDDLSAKMATLQKAISGRPQNDAGRRAAEEDLANARKVFEDALAVEAGGQKLLVLQSQTGEKLIAAVDRIGGLVDEAIVKTESQLSALPGVIQGLLPLAQQLTKVPADILDAEKIQPPAVPKAALADPVTIARSQLAQSARTAQGHANTVAAIVNSIPAANRKLPDLSACGVDISKIATGLTLFPEGNINLTVGQKATRRIVLSGGKPSYFAKLLEEPVDGLKVESKTLPGMAFVEITTEASKLKSEGTYHVHITDTAGNTAGVKIVVGKKKN